MSILAQANPIYQPALRIISSITNATQAFVTTTFNHQYTTGLIVRIDIPTGFGMQEINQLFGTITVTGNTTFTIAIDTTLFSAFSIPAGNTQYAQSVPIGEDNSTVYLATRNILPYPAS